MNWSAIVLAGSRPGSDPFAATFGLDLKALIPVCGEPMVRRPVRVLLENEKIGSVMVLAQAPARIASVLPAHDRLTARGSGSTIASTLLALCDDPATQWPLLITTADHALLDGQMIEDFCSRAEGADLALALVERGALLRRLPESRRTWVKFRGGAYSGANLFALGSPRVRPAIELWRAVEQDRKKGWRLLLALGPSVLAGAALRLLTIDQVAHRVGKRLNLRARVLLMANPLAAVDVDKREDHRLVEALIEGRR